MTDQPPNQSNLSRYSPAQASEILQLPASTLRRYSQTYAHLLSDHAGRPGRKRTYTPDDLRVLKRIRDLTAQRKAPSEIEALLHLLETPAPPPPPIDEDLRLAPYIAGQFEQITAMITQMQQEQADRLAALEAQIAELQARLDRPRSFWDRIRGK